MSTALGLNATHKEIITALNQKSDNDTLWGMPIGAIYVQYKGQQDPTTLFGGTWEDISNEYAGCFFRASGGDAANFGDENQKGGAPNITGSLTMQDTHHRGELTVGGEHMDMKGSMKQYTYKDLKYTQQFVRATEQETSSSDDVNVSIDMDASRCSNIYSSDITEVRPVNSTIKIWKRTA